MSRSLFVLQGGGPTAVINATLVGVAEHASCHFDHLFGLPHSFEGEDEKGVLDLTDLMKNGPRTDALDKLLRTPGSVLGSSRKKVEEQDLERVLNLMQKAGSDALIGIGGNGTMVALNMLSEYAKTKSQDIQVIGAPKTVDNDLPGVHVAPGYGSAARFIAMAVRDYDRDFRAMSTFDDVTILETMGRNTGWIAAASILLKEDGSAPDIVLLPENPFDEKTFLQEVHAQHQEKGRVFIVVNEMLNSLDGGLVGEKFQDGPVDSLGRKMYSLSLGTGNYLTHRIWNELGLQTRCLRPGSLGRALSCCVSEPDRELAFGAGKAAVEAFENSGDQAQMVTIDEKLEFGTQNIHPLVNGSRPLPEKYLLRETFGVSDQFVEYAKPLIGHISPLY